MKTRFSVLHWFFLALVFLPGCGDTEPEPGVKICTVAVGAFDADGNFTSTDKIPFRVGNKYGYQLSVHSTSGRVKVKEVLELPQPATWNDSDVPSGVKILGAETSADRKTHSVSYEIECGDKMAIQDRIYSMIESDPKGLYRFEIYLDDQLASQDELQIE